MRASKKWRREFSNLTKQLYEAGVEYYDARENKTYIAKGKMKRSNSNTASKEEAAACTKGWSVGEQVTNAHPWSCG